MLINRTFLRRMAIATCFAYTVLLAMPVSAQGLSGKKAVNTTSHKTDTIAADTIVADKTATKATVTNKAAASATAAKADSKATANATAGKKAADSRSCKIAADTTAAKTSAACALVADTIAADTIAPRIVEHPKWNFGTNLLEWIGVMPNLKYTTWAANVYGEFYFKKQFSVRITAAYSEHHYAKREKFQGFTSYILEPRYWFRKDGTFQGLSCGIYGQLGDYNDVDPDRKYTGHFWGAGLSAGYLYPIWKGLAAEFTVRAGYRSTEIKKYVYNSAGDRCLCQRIDKNQFVLSGFALNLSWRF